MENAKRWAKFLREKPPYNLFEIETEDFRFLASEFTIKMEAFCDKCGKERIFKCYNKDGIKSIKGELLENTPQPTQTSREPYKSSRLWMKTSELVVENVKKKLRMKGIMDNDIILHGVKVVVYSLKQEDVESYLRIYKKASAFSEAYERMPDFWEHTYQSIKNEIFSEQGSKKRYLIAEKDFSQRYGYIELDYSDSAMPEVNIAMLEEHMGKGYATDAARILFAYILEQGSVKCVVWHAFSRNTASCRVAEKLGGTVVDGKNLIAEAMRSAGFNMDLIDKRTIAKTVTYEIKKVL